MNTLIVSIRDEFRRYQKLAEGAFAQVPEHELSTAGPSNGNSLTALCWHVSGNLQSRFTEFLTTDGEKPWRDREEEFTPRNVSRDELLEKWRVGWDVLFTTLDSLSDTQLMLQVTIRNQPMAVHEALHRALAHVSYHVGQIVYVAHAKRGSEWKYLSIPPGESAAYNAAPTFEKAAAYVAAVDASAVTPPPR